MCEQGNLHFTKKERKKMQAGNELLNILEKVLQVRKRPPPQEMRWDEPGKQKYKKKAAFFQVCICYMSHILPVRQASIPLKGKLS